MAGGLGIAIGGLPRLVVRKGMGSVRVVALGRWLVQMI
jgi:hypothetical protein